MSLIDLDINQKIQTKQFPSSFHFNHQAQQSTLKYLLIIILSLLTYTNYLHHKDIQILSNTMGFHLHVDHESYQKYTNQTIIALSSKIELLEKTIQKYHLSSQLDIVNHKAQVNATLQNNSLLLQQLDESLNNLQRKHLLQQFITRRQTMQTIINKNQTIQSFEEEYQKYTDQYYLSLNNIENPYYDIQSRANLSSTMANLTQRQYLNYQENFYIDSYTHELSMCIVVPTHNNAFQNRYIYNIQSILNQKYSNYIVVIVDDHSDDGTPILIQRYLRKKNVSKDKVVVIKKTEKEGSLSNIYYAVHNYCRNYTVTLEVDGDDELIGSYVFKLFNAVYQSRNPGFAYSNHVYYAEDEGYISKGYSEAYSKLSIEKQNYRKVIQKFGHLRSFRTDLFFRIAEQDLRDAGGRFFLAAGDEAYVFPMLEMSCRNIEYIDEATYLYNGATGNNVRRAFKQLQEENAVFIRLQKKYSCLPIYQNSLINV